MPIILVIGQCNSTVKGTVNMSCLCKWTECVVCMCCGLAFFRMNCFFLMKMYNRWLVFSSNFDIVLIN